MRLLLDYAWPGNIRELQNVLQRALVMNAGDTIHHVDLPDIRNDNPGEAEHSLSVPLKQWLVEKEKQYLAQKLNDLGGNVGLTAKSCRIGVRTLSRKLHQYGLDKAVFKQRETVRELPPSEMIHGSGENGSLRKERGSRSFCCGKDSKLGHTVPCRTVDGTFV
jgi:hypothetical protein